MNAEGRRAIPALPHFLLVACILIPAAVRAQGSIDLSWDRPAGPTQPPILSRPYSGPGSYDLYVTLTGQSVPVRVYLIELLIGVGEPFQVGSVDLPAAWRFDGGGCHAGKACFVGGGLLDGQSPLQGNVERVTGLSYDPRTKRGRLVFAEAYPLPLESLDPDRTCTLARFRFEHTGTCSGEEDSVFVAVRQARWVTEAQDVEHVSQGENQDFVVWNGAEDDETHSPAVQLAPQSGGGLLTGYEVDPFLQPCDVAVPAIPKTWGQLKVGYR